MLIETVLYCLAFGGFAGVIAGLFGIGGGVVLVPFFIWLYTGLGFDESLIMIMAIATSLATIIVTSISSVLTHQRLGSVLWEIVYLLVPGILIGSVLGAMTADYLPGHILKIIFAIYLFYIGLQMAMQTRPRVEKKKQTRVLFFYAGNLVGLLSAILGIGGGTIIVPFLVKCNIAMRNAVAVSSACSIPIAVTGTISYALLGWNKPDLPEASLGYIYLPAFFGIVVMSMLTAPLGALLANRLPAQTLKRYFSVLLFLVAAKLVW